MLWRIYDTLPSTHFEIKHGAKTLQFFNEKNHINNSRIFRAQKILWTSAKIIKTSNQLKLFNLPTYFFIYKRPVLSVYFHLVWLHKIAIYVFKLFLKERLCQNPLMYKYIGQYLRLSLSILGLLDSAKKTRDI